MHRFEALLFPYSSQLNMPQATLLESKTCPGGNSSYLSQASKQRCFEDLARKAMGEVNISGTSKQLNHMPQHAVEVIFESRKIHVRFKKSSHHIQYIYIYPRDPITLSDDDWGV